MNLSATRPVKDGRGRLRLSAALALCLGWLLSLAFNLSCSSSKAEGRPAIESFTAAASTVAPGASTTLTAKFSGDSGSLDHGLGAVTSGASVTTGPLTESTTFTLTVKNWLGGSATATTRVMVAALPQALTPVITAPASAMAGTAGLLASVPDQANCTFTWTLGNGGTITAGQGTRQITFTAGSAGTLTLGCVAQLANGSPSAPASASVTVVPVPQALTPVITAPAPAMAGTPGLLASVPAQADCTFTWTITGGTLTAGQGTHQITFTAGAAGTLTLGCVAQLSTGTPSAQAAASVTIVPVPQAITPVITAPVATMAGATGLLASVPDQANGTFTWTITGGTITAGQGTRELTFTAGAAGTLTLGCVAQLTTGTPSAAGTASVTVPALAISSFTSDSMSFYAGLTAKLTPVFTGGTGVITPGDLTAISGTPVTVKPAENTTYTLKITNGLGETTQLVLDLQVNAVPVVARQLHCATTLKDGRVLLTGGLVTDSDTENVLSSASLYDPATGLTLPAGVMSSPRAAHTATLLPSGKVLIVGGSAGTGVSANASVKGVSATLKPADSATSSFELSTAELFDPATGTFTLCAGGLSAARMGHTATLAGGTVLIAGGGISDGISPAFNTAESYDPATDTFTPLASPLIAGRASHTATLLANGQVLLAGGNASLNVLLPLASAELFDPATRTFSATNGPLAVSRSYHTATLLGDGTVLITGGIGGDPADPAIRKTRIAAQYLSETYDPLTGTFLKVGSMNAPRYGHTATLLADGKVLIAGGHASSLGGSVATKSSALMAMAAAVVPNLAPVQAVGIPASYLESYDPTSKAFQLGSNLSGPRSLHTATLLAQNKVLFVGGWDAQGSTLASSEVYDPQFPGATAEIPPPVILSLNPVVTGGQYNAQVGNASAGNVYTWTVNNGTLLPGPAGLSLVPFVAGSVGPMALNCVVTTPAGSVSAMTTLALDVVATAPTPTLELALTKDTIIDGESTALSWITTGATQVSLLPLGYSYSGSPTGSLVLWPAETTTYTLTASNSDYQTSVSKQFTVTVNHLPSNPGIMAPQYATTGLAGWSASVWPQAGCTMTWAITGGTFAGGGTTASGESVSFTAGEVGILQLTCTATNGTGQVSNVQPVTVVAQPTATFSASRAFILNGQSSTLSWTHTGYFADLSGLGSVAAEGSSIVTPGETMTYTLIVDNLAGTRITKEVTVTMASLLTPRHNHTATLLPSGKILFAGGYANNLGLASAEVFDPATGISVATANPMAADRQLPTATLLGDGTVLIAGGSNADNDSNQTADLFNPATNAFTPTTGSMGVARTGHLATLLPDGKVLLSGGQYLDPNSHQYVLVASAELYDPALGTFAPTASTMTSRRSGGTATLLLNGKVLLTGGGDTVFTELATGELYDPALGSFTRTPGGMSSTRLGHTATLLPDGKVLVAGGFGVWPNIIGTAELFDPATGTFTLTTSQGQPSSLRVARTFHEATLLPNGKVLFLGGMGNSVTPDVLETYDPATGAFALTGDLQASSGNTLTLLPTGQLLLAGNGNGYPIFSLKLLSTQDAAPGFPAVIFPCPVRVLPFGQPASIAPLFPGSGLTWSVSPDLAPAGLSINPATGELSGTPVAPISGVFRVTASNGTNSSSCDLRITVK